MENLEKRFDCVFEKNMKRDDNGMWYHRMDKMKNICKKKSVNEFKRKYPDVFDNIYNQWFDKVHPY